MRYAAHSHSRDPIVKIHAADCSKSITPQPHYCEADALTAETLEGARAEIRAALDAMGRDDITVSVCACARAAARREAK